MAVVEVSKRMQIGQACKGYRRSETVDIGGNVLLRV